MRRWHQEVPLMQKRMKLERKKHGVGPDVHDGEICHCLLGIGFVRKRKPYDCGRTRCMLCHTEKYWPDKSRARKKREAIEFNLRATGL